MNTKKQKENNKYKNKEIKNIKIDEEVFARIKTKFTEYWKVLFKLIGAYIISYFVWSWLIVKKGSAFTKRHGWDGNKLWFIIILIIFQGLLFCVDGFVTSLLKSPFNQMCYAINKAEGISDKKKDYIITKATESNEHCKETLKKFGIITIASQLITYFVKVSLEENGKRKMSSKGDYGELMVISYLIPIFFAALDIWQIHRELKKIEKTIIASRGKKA